MDKKEAFCENPAAMRHQQLAERVSFLEVNKREVKKMGKFIEDLQDGREKEYADLIRDNES